MSDSNQLNTSSKSIGAGLLVAFTASLCCITPVFATLAGIGGVAATFSWMEPFRPFLIGLTVLVLGFAWYQKLKPRTKEEIECACEPARPAGGDDEKPSFWQSRKFLGIVTVISVMMLAFPSYSHVFYNTPNNQTSSVFAQDTIRTHKIYLSVEAMTCTGCEMHVVNEITKLDGIDSVKASYKDANTFVSYNPQKVSKEQIIEAVNSTGYKVIDNKQN